MESSKEQKRRSIFQTTSPPWATKHIGFDNRSDSSVDIEMGAPFYVKCLDELGCFDTVQINTILNACIERYSLHSHRQINLTAKNEDSGAEHLTQGVGSFFDREKREWFDSDSHYVFLNNLFRGTELERYFVAVQSMGWKMGRMRLMRMAPKSCYSLHADEENRVHLPLITHSEAHLQFYSKVSPSKLTLKQIKNFLSGERESRSNPILEYEVKSFHLPATGYSYLTQTRLPHSAVNMSDHERWHLVASVRN